MRWRLYIVYVFFFKQKTAYEMRISDWSSDVCSSDLDEPANSVFYGENIVITGSAFAGMVDEVPALSGIFIEGRAIHVVANRYKIGRASCREIVCQYV